MERTIIVGAGLLAVGSMLTACTKAEYVTRPANSSNAPTFTVGNNVLDNHFAVDQSISTANGTVNAKLSTEILLTVTAANPVSGVKSLDVAIATVHAPLYNVHMDGVPLANGDVPIYLRLLGTDGAGHSGTQPLLLVVSVYSMLMATATSFDGTSASIALNYQPWEDVDATLQASPSPIPFGASSTLTWTTKNSFQPFLMGPSVLGPAGYSGSLEVTPTSTADYFLTASNPFGSVQKKATVQVTNTGSLKVTYQGVASGAAASPTITLSGQNPTAPASSPGQPTFSKSYHPTFTANQPWVVSDTFNNLAPGVWTVSVAAAEQGTIICANVTVPGAITINRDGALQQCQP